MLSQLLWHKNVLLRVAKSLAYINYTRLSNRQNADTQLCDNDGLHCLKGRVGEEKGKEKRSSAKLGRPEILIFFDNFGFRSGAARAEHGSSGGRADFVLGPRFPFWDGAQELLPHNWKNRFHRFRAGGFLTINLIDEISISKLVCASRLGESLAFQGSQQWPLHAMSLIGG